MRHLGDPPGSVILQLHENFFWKDIGRLEPFPLDRTKDDHLVMKFRHIDRSNNDGITSELHLQLETPSVMNIIADIAGRCGLLHMPLTTRSAFVRYVGANDPATDRSRLDQGVRRLRTWVELGIGDIHFFVHENHELGSPLLAAIFIKKFNAALGTKLNVPRTLDEQDGLFEG